MKVKPRRSPALRVIAQPDHVVEVQLGGAARPPSVPGRKVLYRFPGAKWLRGDVPATRAECKDGPRPCPHVRCEHHLWVQAGEDRVGRPPAEDGYAQWRGGDPGRKRPAVLEARSMTTCELDIEDRGERSTREIGAALGVSQRRVQQEIKAALAKVRAMKLTIDELRELLLG